MGTFNRFVDGSDLTKLTPKSLSDLAFSQKPKELRQLAKAQMEESFVDCNLWHDLVSECLSEGKINGRTLSEKEIFWLFKNLFQRWNFYESYWYGDNVKNAEKSLRKNLFSLYVKSMRKISKEKLAQCQDPRILMNYYLEIKKSRLVVDKICARLNVFDAAEFFQYTNDRYLQTKLGRILLKNNDWRVFSAVLLVEIAQKAQSFGLRKLQQKIMQVLAQKDELLAQGFLACEDSLDAKTRNFAERKFLELSQEKDGFWEGMIYFRRFNYSNPAVKKFFGKLFEKKCQEITTYRDWREMFDVFGDEICRKNEPIMLDALTKIKDDPANVFHLLKFNSEGVYAKECQEVNFIQAVYDKAYQAVKDDLILSVKLWRFCQEQIEFAGRQEIFSHDVSIDLKICRQIFANILTLVKSKQELTNAFATEKLTENEKMLFEEKLKELK